MASTAIALQTVERTTYRLHSTAATPSASRPSKSYQTSQPSASGNGVFDCRHANLGKFAVTGNDDNLNGAIMLWGWSEVTGENGGWLPSLIAELNFTTGAATGVSGGTFTDSEYFADTFTLEAGDTATKVITFDDANIGSFTVDLEGARYVEVAFHTNGLSSTVTSASASIAVF